MSGPGAPKRPPGRGSAILGFTAPHTTALAVIVVAAAIAHLVGALALDAAVLLTGTSVIAWGVLSRVRPRAGDGRPRLTTERWQVVSRVFEAALELPESMRAAFLQGECADASVRREVNSLLAAHARSGILDVPVTELAAPVVAAGAGSVAPGQAVSHYEMLDRLGGGGMGVVYRARDVQLGRLVALKFLPQHLSLDAGAKGRFMLEARTAAALDHSNICTIYEIGETNDGQLFIAMPCYDGETLEQRIGRGPLPIDEAVDIAIQVARGLGKAHERGIIHRDIKPANLLLTAEGLVKILDFGIAKLMDVTVTPSGGTPGTVAYMSPEQVRGGALDGRTDLWSLAVVLFEMITGRRPFGGDHEGEILRAILETAPASPGALRPGVPDALDGAVLAALAKRPADRYASAMDLIEVLERVRAGAGGGMPDRAPGGGPGAGGASPGVLPEGERRQATVVRSTLCGFAALAESLPPASLGRLVEYVRACAGEIASRQGGTVDQFAADEIGMLFGIPTTHEDDSVRAVRAALELHERVRVTARELAPETEVRLGTGIDTGAVVAQPLGPTGADYRIAGAAPQMAARLAAHAAAGEILITPECRRLAGAFFRTEPAQPLVLRDRDVPLVPYRVAGESGLTRLEAAGAAGLTAFTGRDRELARLRGALAEATGGRGHMMVVLGEAGMGKSRLLYEFRQCVDESDVRVLQGRCASRGSGTAYLPFVQTLGAGLTLDTVDSLRSHADEVVSRVRQLGRELDEFLPFYLHLLSLPSEAYPVPTHMHGDTLRLAMQDALAALFTVMSERQPTVLLLEDWHWADESSHAVLRQLAELAGGYRLLIVVTSRPGYVADWGSAGQFTALTLPPLEESLSISVLASMLAVERFPRQLGARIHERTGGNPFFLEEICHTLREEGALVVHDGRVELTRSPEALELPDSIQAVIRARIDHLAYDVRETLRTASVVGREFTRALLEEVQPGRERLRASLEVLKSAGLIQQTHVVPEAAFRFKHALTQEVASASLLGHQREELHGRVGRAIERAHADRLEEHAERLAHHFSRARDWEKAVRYSIRAADRLSALALFGEALTTLEQAQTWVHRLPAGQIEQQSLIDIQFRQERLCETLGLRGRQQRIIDDLIRLLEPAGDRAALAEAYLRQGDLHTLLGSFDAADHALQRSLEIRRQLGDRMGERNTLRSLGLQRWHAGRDREALQAVERALALDRERGDVDAIIGDLSNLGSVLKGLGRLDEARACLEEALDLTARLTSTALSPIKLPYILHILANVHRELGDPERALEYLTRAKDHTIEKRLAIQLSYHDTAIAHIHLQRGDIEASLEHYREAVELTRTAGFAPGLAQALRFLGELLFGLGRRDEALAPMREAATLFAQLGDAPAEAGLWSRIAAVLEQRQNDPEALAAWAKVRVLRQKSRDPAGEMEALERLAAVTRRHVAEGSLALACYHDALKLAERLADPIAEGRIRYNAGVLEWERGAWERALEHYERALELFRDAGDEAHAGLMHNSIGVTLRALGRKGEAKERLEHAVALHRQCGNALLEGHALAVLGDLWRDAGEADNATECYTRSLDIRRTIGDRPGEGWMLRALADVHLAHDASDRARDLVAEAARIAAECGDAALARACERL